MSNSLPDGWHAENLGDIAEFSGGSAFKEMYQGETSGTHPFIKVSDMNLTGNERHITRSNNWVSEEIRKQAKIRLFPSDATVFAKVGAALLLNRRRQLVRETAIDNNMMAAVPLHCCPEFLYFSMQTIDLKTIVQSGAVPSVNQSQMEYIPVNTPPLPEQKKIASILTSVDEVIENTQKQIDKLQDLKKATMNELLTKGIGHTEFKDSELGQIPVGWEVQALSSLSLLITKGATPATSSDPYIETGTIFYRSVNASEDGLLKTKNIKHISDKANSTLRRSMLRAGDVMISIVGAKTGKTFFAITKESELPGNINQNIALIRPKPAVLNSRLLTYTLSSPYFQNQVDRELTTQAQPCLSLKQIGDFFISVPKYDEQLEIVKKLDSISNLISNNHLKAKSFLHLKKSLMQDLLTGKVRVTVN